MAMTGNEDGVHVGEHRRMTGSFVDWRSRRKSLQDPLMAFIGLGYISHITEVCPDPTAHQATCTSKNRSAPIKTEVSHMSHSEISSDN